MNAFTIALYDIETSNNPFPDGERLPDDEIGFALGIVRYVTFWRAPNGTVSRARRLENVHFSPVALLDDLLRPWAHAVCGYNALQFDNPVVVANAVYPEPGVYLGIDATQAEVDALELRLRDAGLPAGSARYMAHLDPGTAAAFAARVELRQDHSRLIVPGSVGIAARQEDVRAALDARTFDPLAILAEMTGHPHVAKLDYFRASMDMKPFELDGREVSGAEVPGLWNDGQVWAVADKCRHDLNVLEELLHHAFFGGEKKARLLVDKLNRSWTDENGEKWEAPIEAYLNPAEGAKHRYRINTGFWWDRVATIAAASR